LLDQAVDIMQATMVKYRKAIVVIDG